MFDFKSIEERVQKFWDDRDIFSASMKRRAGREPFVLFEGPPTANGNPGIHHFLARAFKDLVGRYQTMKGRYVLRKGGWDTHGLPVELQVEKALGFKNKKDIEAYGIAEFNRKCRESVWQYRAEWERFTRRSGYWVDLERPYVTYETPYTESVWHVLAAINKKKLLYQAHRVVPFCTRCGTPLSSHEVAQGYKNVSDTSLYVKFHIKKSSPKLKLPKNTSVLAWTTTPWTLPGNVALAVGADIRYVLARKGEEYFVIAEELANKVLGAPLAIEKEFYGKDLIGLQYEPLFAVRALKSTKSHRIYGADFVTTSDGTGVVHIAPMYGEDDYTLGTAAKLPMYHTVTEQGHFVGVSEELDGMYAKSGKAETAIIEKLKIDNHLLSTVSYEHEYPFCWRCDTALIYYAKDSWFIRTSTLNKQLLANNQEVNWVPAHIKEGRFGQWLREARDWNLSRDRYWGTPLPVWSAHDKTGKRTGTPLVISGLDDFDTYRSRKANTYWIVRHGEGEQNVSGILDGGNGHNYQLTSRGEEQVVRASKELKRKLGRKKPAVILASPLFRTQETAKVISKELGVKVTTDERLREIQLGPSFDQHPVAQYHDAFPSYKTKFLQQPPGGESLSDVRARMWTVLRDLEEEHEGKDIVIVCHEYPLWMLTDAAQGWSMEQSIAEKEKRGDEFIRYAEVQKISVRNLPRNEHGVVDLHRPYIDQVVLKKGGKLLHRVPDLMDVWFDSGAMPYAQWHWPFENKDVFAQQYPADFIAEGIDQTRGWFYTLLAVATALGMEAPYRNAMALSHVLDEKGQKMSKSKGNVVSPFEVMDAVGTDTARWYFYTVNNPGDPKLFNMKEVRERMTGFMGTLANCYRFYELYQGDEKVSVGKEHLLDRWVQARMSRLVADVTDRLDEYDVTTAARAIEQFVIDDFSQWWLRRSRRRQGVQPLLRNILKQIAIISAPFIPFTAEELWHKLRESDEVESVHLADWPVAKHEHHDSTLEEQMTQVRQHVSAGLALRKEEAIKVRQPLASVTVPGQPLAGDLEELMKDELNVKEVRYAAGEPVSLDTTVSADLRAEGWAREVMRTIQDMRKEAGLKMGEKAHATWQTDDESIREALQVHISTITHDTSLSAFIEQADIVSGRIEKEFDLEPGRKLRITLTT